MIVAPRSPSAAPDRKPHRRRADFRPTAEALEGRAVPAVSITANLAGLVAPVLSLTIPQPPSTGLQSVGLTLELTAGDVVLFKDAAAGTHLERVEIAVHQDATGGTDTIALSDAIVSSIKLVGGLDGVPDIALTLASPPAPIGPITASFDGQASPVVGVTIPEGTASGPQVVTLTLQLTAADVGLYKDAIEGKPIGQVVITQHPIGNGPTYSLTLTDALVSFQIVGGTVDLPEVVVTLISAHETTAQS